MSGHCCPSDNAGSANDPVFRKVLWFALLVNAAMFVVEILASEMSDSLALKADALDFFGDSANYAISLFVVNSSPVVRAKASIVKGLTMLLFAVFVLLTAAVKAVDGSTPVAETMGVIGVVALLANVSVAAALYRFRSGDSNMQSVWLCSRNDAIGNIAVVLAAIGVMLTASRWPDLVVALIIASLAFTSALRIFKLARQEIKSQQVPGAPHVSSGSVDGRKHTLGDS